VACAAADLERGGPGGLLFGVGSGSVAPLTRPHTHPPSHTHAHTNAQRIKLSPEKAIFIFVNNVLPPSSSLLSHVYAEHKDADGFLYIVYSSENTFGSVS
jgi:hypothetical protein